MSSRWMYCQNCDTYNEETSDLVSFKLSRYMIQYEHLWYSTYLEARLVRIGRTRIFMTEKQFGHFMATRAIAAENGDVKNSTMELKIEYHKKPKWKKVFVGAIVKPLFSVEQSAQGLANTVNANMTPFEYKTKCCNNVEFEVRKEAIGNNWDGKSHDQYNVYVWRKNKCQM